MKFFIFRPAYILFPIALFSLIYFNDKLFVSFMATSVILLSIYFTAISLISLFVLRKREMNIERHDSSAPIHPGDTMVKFTISGFKDSIPGFMYYLDYDIYENKKRIGTSRTQIHPEDASIFSMTLSFNRHGSFLLKNLRFVLTDLFHFTEVNKQSDSTVHFHVKPLFYETNLEKISLDSGGTQPVQSSVRLNSSDLFDFRKYYPGDDMRKINWKIFAHTRELHIRELEKTPPEIGEINVLFAPYSEDANVYELTSGIFYSSITQLLEYNITINILHPADPKPVTITKDDYLRLDDILYSSHAEYPYPAGHFDYKTVSMAFFSAEEFVRLEPEIPFSNEANLTVCEVDATTYKENMRKIFLKVITSDSVFKDFKYNLRLSLAKQEIDTAVREKIRHSGKKITLIRG